MLSNVANNECITEINDYKSSLTGMPRLFVENPEFNNMVDSEIIRSFNRKGETKVFNSGNSIYLEESPTIENVNGSVIVKQTVLDARLLSDNRLEVVKITGNMYTAKSYYKQVDLNDGEFVYDVNCERHVFDRNGIELANSSYYKSGLKVQNNPSKSLKDIITKEITDEDVVIPKSWDDRSGPALPKKSEGAYVSGSQRMSGNFEFDGYTGVQRNYTYSVIEKNIPKYHTEYLARVSRKWPERLSFDEFGLMRFAERDKDGIIRPTEMYKEYSLGELCSSFSFGVLLSLDKSMTKEYSKQQYEALKRKLMAENKDMLEKEKVTKARKK